MFKMEQETHGNAVILRLSGRIQSGHVRGIEAQMPGGGFHAILDLAEITLVDIDVVRFFNSLEQRGVELVRCPPYVREWMVRERIEGDGAV